MANPSKYELLTQYDHIKQNARIAAWKRIHEWKTRAPYTASELKLWREVYNEELEKRRGQLTKIERGLRRLGIPTPLKKPYQLRLVSVEGQ